MRQITNSHWICCVILAVVFALPAQARGEEISPAKEARQELLSPEMVQELAGIYYERARTYYRKGQYLKAKAEFEEVLNFEPGHQGALWYLNFVRKELLKSKKYRSKVEKLKKKTKKQQKVKYRAKRPKPEKKSRPEKAAKVKKVKKDLNARRAKQLEKQKKSLEASLKEYQSKNDEVKKGKEAAAYRVRQLQEEKDRLEARLKEYANKDDGAKKAREVNARKVKQLQKEKGRLEAKLEKYRQIEERHQEKIQQIQQKLEREKSARLKKAKTGKENLTVELDKLRREQQAQLEKELAQYEKALKSSFAEKIEGYNKKITNYEKILKENENKIKRLEKASRQLNEAQDKTQKLARIKADIHKETTAFKQEEEASHKLKEQLAELRKSQEAEVKSELERYEKTFQDRLARKEAELDEKVRLYDIKIKELQAQKPLPPVQRIDRAETGLLGLQMKANEELRLQLDVFKKEKAQPFYEEGLDYVRAKKYTLARASFQKALSVYPDYAQVREALRDIEKQERIAFLLSEGEYYYKEEDYPKAVEQFDRVLALDYKNKEARGYLHRIEEYVKQNKRAEALARQKEQARLKKEEERKAKEAELARLKAEKEKKIARLKAEKEKKIARLKAQKEANIARLKAEQEEKLRLKREAEARQKEQARLKKEEERKAKEAELARLKAKEEKRIARLKAEKEKKIACLKAKQEEKLRLNREAEARQKEQARLKKEEERKAKEAELARLKAEKEKKIARLKAKQEEKLRLKRESEARRREQARLKKEEERKAREAELARLKAEKEKKIARLKAEKEKKLARLKAKKEEELALLNAERQAKAARIKAEKEAEAERLARQKEKKDKVAFYLSQGQYYYKKGNNLKAIENFNQILALDYKNKNANEYLHRIEEDIKERKRAEALVLQREQARQKKEAKIARIKAEQEEKLRLKRETEAKRQEEARLKQEEERKAKEAELARLKAEKEKKIARLKAQKEANIARLKAEQEEKLRVKREAEARRREQARLKQEEERKAKEMALARLKAEKKKRVEDAARLKAEKKAKIARLKAEKEEQLRLKREAEAKRQEEARLKKEKEAEQKAIREAEREMIEQARIKACEEKLKLRKAEEKKKKEALQKKIDMHYARGKKHFENRDYIAARKEFKDILTLDFGNQYAVNALEKVDATIAREEKELKVLERKKEEEKRAAVKRKVKHHLGQGKIYYYQENYHDAIAEFSKILFIEPSNAAAEKYIQHSKKKISEARRREYARPKEEKADNSGLEKLTQQQRKAERNAVKRAQRALSKQKKTKGRGQRKKVSVENEEEEKTAKITKLYEKGRVYFQQGRYLDAVACFEKVIELEGNPAIYYTPQAKDFIERARIEMEEKKKEDARKIAEDELKFRKTRKQQSVHEHYKRGKAYYRQGNYPMAIAEFNKVGEIDSQHKDASSAEQYIQKCRAKIMQSQEAEVRAEMKREGTIQEGVSSESLLTQAQWYYKRGDYEQAIKVARAALELDYLNKKARDLLHRAELKQTKKAHKQAYKEVGIDEKGMMAEVAELQVLPEEETIQVPEKEIETIVKVPVIREKLKNPLTVDFRDVDLTYVLDFLADSTGVNIIAASGVSLEDKKVTIRIKDMPTENALKYILKNQGLTYRIEEDAIWVASPGEMEKEEVESRVYFLNRGTGMFTEFERTVGTGTGLGGAAAISKVTTIKDILEEAVDWPKNSKLVLDDRSGALVISNIPSNLQLIEEILYNLDITPVQVLIETRFIELEVTDVEQLGIEWQITEAYGDRRNEDKDNITQFEDTAGWDFSSFTNYATEGMNLTYSGVLTYPQFQSVLHALSRTQNAKTLSSPRISTLNNQMATIKVVDEWIYPTRYEFQVVQSDVNGDGDFDDANETIYQNVPVDFVTKDVGILLHVTPNVGGDGKTVTLALVPEVSEGTSDAFSYTGSVSLPKFTSRTLSTSVVINNGETVALGGLVKETTTKTVTKVPFIGDIPFLGALFRKKSDSVVRKNLLIFVTATIVSPDGERIETVQSE
jgi:trichohyalin